MRKRKLFSCVLTMALSVSLLSNTISVHAETDTNTNQDLQVLSYEEFKEALKNGTSTYSNSVSLTDGKKSISEITDKTYSIDDFNMDYKLTVDVSNISNTKTAPTPNLQIIVDNADSLKNGSATTDTVLIWLYNDSDADGDTITARMVEGFPEGYILGGLNDNTGREIGFVTEFFNPGEYTVDYYVMDSHQEISGIRYTLDVLTKGDYSVYTGELSSPTVIDTYTVPIDFSAISTAAITYVQSGDTDLMVTIKDESGAEVTKMSSSNSIARRWFFIDRPVGVRGIYNYTVTVAVNNNDYHIDSSGYRIMAGSKNDMEEMISYVDNAVLLGKYTAKNGTYDFRTGYTPSNYDSYYKFTADGPATVTAMTNYIQTRFKILDAKTMITVYDSQNDNEAHRTEYTVSYPYIEKQRLGFNPGVEYYLVLYANNPVSTAFITDNITLTQGMGRLINGRDYFTANNSITGGTGSFSPSATISITDGVPVTAQVKTVEFVSTDGIHLSDINTFRVKAQYGHTNWRNSVTYWKSIDYPYTPDGNSNTPLIGNWLYGFRTNSGTLTMTPIVAIQYDYEFGD